MEPNFSCTFHFQNRRLSPKFFWHTFSFKASHWILSFDIFSVSKPQMEPHTQSPSLELLPGLLCLPKIMLRKQDVGARCVCRLGINQKFHIYFNICKKEPRRKLKILFLSLNAVKFKSYCSQVEAVLLCSETESSRRQRCEV